MIEASEEVKREILRRQTWIAEENERYNASGHHLQLKRRRRIMEDLAEDFQQDVLREIQRREALFLEERARQESQEIENRRAVAPTEEDIQQNELHELVQLQFMAKVHRKEVAIQEEKERNIRLLENELSERYQSEMDRRYTFLLEERERVRRVIQDLAIEYQEQASREARKFEVIQLEEAERERRIRQEKTKSKEYTENFSDGKFAVQEQLLSSFDRIKVAYLEEAERMNRLQQEQQERKIEEGAQQMESKLDRIIAREMEEKERQRRLSEDLKQQFNMAMESEMARRKSFLLEEEERQRRMLEDKNKPHVNSLIRELSVQINSRVNQKLGPQGKENAISVRRITEDTVQSMMPKQQ